MQILHLSIVAAATALLISSAANMSAADSEAQMKAREALRRKMAETQSSAEVSAAKSAQGAVASPSNPSTFRPVPADSQAIERARQAVRQEVEQPRQSASAGVRMPSAQVPPPPDEAKIEKAREALRKAMEGPLPSGDGVATSRRPAVDKSGFPQIEAPASPLPADKQEQLADLLRRYKADQISSEEYHRERAKIITGK